MVQSHRKCHDANIISIYLVEEEEYLKGIDIDEMDGVLAKRNPDKEKKK